MKVRWAALLAVLALGVLVPGMAAQGTPSTQGIPPAPPSLPRSPDFVLGQNSPNPFNQATVLPFTLGDPPACADGNRAYRVTLRIYNVLAQLVAIPILQTGSASSGQPVVGVMLKCGNYTAFWSGNYLNTSQTVPPGVYLYRIEVDGRAVVQKMVVVE